jgi:hypothetical protein
MSVPDYPNVEKSRDRLPRADWSVGGEGSAPWGGARSYWVFVRRGDVSAVGEGKDAGEAWHLACEAALGGQGGVP